MEASALPHAVAVGATAQAGRALRIWEAYGLVFLASGCSLVLEILAGRILAPYLGVSLYTWTSIIGVILAGITFGNYLGGLLADRMAARSCAGSSSTRRSPSWRRWCWPLPPPTGSRARRSR